jgi:hypothetical protein
VASPELEINLNTHTPIQIWNSEQFKRARLKFIAGEQIPQCNNCWREESSGINSHRIVEKKKKRVKREQAKSVGFVESVPSTIDLKYL